MEEVPCASVGRRGSGNYKKNKRSAQASTWIGRAEFESSAMELARGAVWRKLWNEVRLAGDMYSGRDDCSDARATDFEIEIVA